MKRSDAKLPKGTWFIQELFDCTVIDDNTDKILGTISDVSETGANDVWHIKTPDGEVLIPAIKQVVVSVDVEDSEWHRCEYNRQTCEYLSAAFQAA